MNKKANEVLKEVFSEVIESMAFMFCEDENAVVPLVNEGPYCRATIRFNGFLEGAVQIAAPREFCVSLAANILGDEAGSEQVKEKAEDALKETLNTICGRFLSNYAGDSVVINLLPPLVDRIGIEEWELVRKLENTNSFILEGNPVLLEVSLKEKVSA
jgi:CheY-specific phosphatase CheX